MPLHICAAFQSQRKTCALKPENDSRKKEIGGEFRGRLHFNGRNERGYIFTDGSGQNIFTNGVVRQDYVFMRVLLHKSLHFYGRNYSIQRFHTVSLHSIE